MESEREGSCDALTTDKRRKFECLDPLNIDTSIIVGQTQPLSSLNDTLRIH